MAARRPLVRVGGQNVQLPAGDTLAGVGDFLKDGSVKMTGPINEALPVSMTIGASGAQTVTIDSAAANTVFIDGSGQLTFLGNGTQGNTREVEFNSSVVLANTSRIILPGGADIVTQPGDTAKFRNVDDTNIWKCVWYQRKSGTALVGSPDPSKLPLAGGKMTGVINEANIQTFTTVASGEFDISAITSQTIRVTGSGPISTVTNPPAGSGLELRILFADDGILVRNGGGNILLPGSVNITSKLGDSMLLLQTTSPGIWRCVDYQRADGTALVSAAGPTSTDGLPEGTTNLYYTDARAKAANTDKVQTSSVGAANGVAPLGSDSKIASAYLPSYVDDVLEFANLAVFPATGETGKIYIAIDTNREYRWSGSVYTAIVASPGTTDNVPEGTTNLYFTAARVLNVALAGLSLATGTAVIATDSILVAVGKLQKQITDLTAAVAGKEPTITAGAASQYWNGSKVFTDFAGSVRSAVLTAISFGTSTPVTATDSVLTAIGKLQAQLTAYGGVFRTETIATTSVGQTSYAVPNGYTVGSIIVFFNGVLQAPADYTATDGANVVLASGSLTTSDIMSVLVIGAVRAQDDALLSYAVASLPAASANTAKLRYCTNMAGGAGPVFSNGTQWLRVADNTVVTT